jgi:hypothetical protein
MVCRLLKNPIQILFEIVLKKIMSDPVVAQFANLVPPKDKLQ